MDYNNINLFYQDKRCLICGSNKLKKLEATTYDSLNNETVCLLECKKCYFAWQYPRKRTQVQSIKHFKKEYEKAEGARSKYYDPKLKKTIAELQFNYISNLVDKSGRLLEIGAGSGKFAQIANKNGWSVTAIEPAFEYNTQRNRSEDIEYIKGTIDDLKTDVKYNIITLWDVIEHVDEPTQLIKKAGDFLKEGGWLVIETGNYNSTQRIQAGLKHWIFQLDHRWYFSPDILIKLLESLGYSTIKVSKQALRPKKKKTRSPTKKDLVFRLLKEIIKKPFAFHSSFKKFFRLIEQSKSPFSDVSIFTVAAKKENNIL